MDPLGFRHLFDDAGAARLDRVVLRVRGEAPLAFLNDVGTQEVAALRPGEGALTCFLDEKGRVQAEARALVMDVGDVLLDAEPAAAGYLTGYLARVAPLSRCSVTDETASWRVVAVRGPNAAATLGLESELPSEHSYTGLDHHAEPASGGLSVGNANGALVVRVLWGLPGYDVLSASERQLDVPRVDVDTFEAARIAAGRPRFGVDVTDQTLVNETPLLARAVSMTKGCYPGQESVARVANLGRVRRTLVGLSLPRRVASAPVLLNGDEVGTITSSAPTPDGGAAIAYVRAEVTPGTTVAVDGTEGVVRALE